MKRVLFVATVVKLHINVFHIPHLKWFKDNGYEVHVAAKNDYKNKNDCYIPYCDRFYDVPFVRSPIHTNNIKAFKKIKSIINENDYDIIHTHTPVGGLIGRLAANKSRKKGSMVIYTAHGFHFYQGAPLTNWLLYYPVEKWLSRYTDKLITINQEDYRVASKFKRTETLYIPGIGINTEKMRNIKIDRNKKRKELGIPADCFLMVSVGELNKNKNHEIVLQALGQIKNKNIHYAICGQGDSKEKLEELSINLGIKDQVHLLGFRKDIPEINLASDLFVFPSYREGLSVALMEAMATGLPVIASNIRGNSDLIDKRGGELLSPEDINGFSESIRNIYNKSDQSRKKMGRINRKKIESYNVNNVVKKMEKIYINRM